MDTNNTNNPNIETALLAARRFYSQGAQGSPPSEDDGPSGIRLIRRGRPLPFLAPRQRRAKAAAFGFTPAPAAPVEDPDAIIASGA